MRTKFLPYCTPSIGSEEIAEVVDSLRQGQLSSGPKVGMFERKFADYVRVPHAIAVNSCTTALALALKALRIGPGDEVIVPTFTFCATANVVEHLCATPVLVDVTHEMQIDPDAVARAISPRTRAIIAVHYGGQACQLSELLDISQKRGIPLIQDAAHAVGASYRGKKIGSHGLITAFSFYPSKNMTTGEGGMLTTCDSALAAHIREIALHGIRRSQACAEGCAAWNYEVWEPGYKANLPELLAAIGIQQLRKLDNFISRRRKIARRYSKAFASMESLVLPTDLPDRPHSYHLYAVRILENQANLGRRDLMKHLQQAMIGTSVHYIPLHQQPFYRNKYPGVSGSYPTADLLFRQTVSLPLYPAMSDDDVSDVIEAVCDAVRTSRK